MEAVAAKQKGSVKKAKQRRLSPEELSVLNDPRVTIRFTNHEWNRELGTSAPPLDCSWGGVKWHFVEGKEYEVPLGLIHHIRNHCQNPVYAEVPDPDNPGSTKAVKVSSTPRFTLEPVNYDQMAKAEAQLVAMQSKKEIEQGD